jgi:hypothetical protein
MEKFTIQSSIPRLGPETGSERMVSRLSDGLWVASRFVH